MAPTTVDDERPGNRERSTDTDEPAAEVHASSHSTKSATVRGSRRTSAVVLVGSEELHHASPTMRGIGELTAVTLLVASRQLLVVRGWAEARPLTIGDLAGQLYVKHNTAVSLVDGLVEEGLVTRAISSADRRRVELALTPRGRTVLATLAALHRRELQRLGPVFKRFFAEISF